MQELFYPEEQSSLGSASIEAIITPWHISKADIIEGYILGLTQLTL